MSTQNRDLLKLKMKWKVMILRKKLPNKYKTKKKTQQNKYIWYNLEIREEKFKRRLWKRKLVKYPEYFSSYNSSASAFNCSINSLWHLLPEKTLQKSSTKITKRIRRGIKVKRGKWEHLIEWKHFKWKSYPGLRWASSSRDETKKDGGSGQKMWRWLNKW